MSGMGTDVMALACILGSAAVGGTVTLAALDRGSDGAAVCVSELHEAPVVALSQGGNGQTIVVAPRVRVHTQHGCEAMVVDVNVDPQVRVRLDEARLRMEEARVRMEEARLRVDAELGETLELRLQEELQRVERELARLEGRAVR